MKKTVIGSILMGLLIWLCFAQVVEAEIEQLTLRVDGLACPFCAYGLEKKITRLEGVSSYDVDMKEGKVYIGLEPKAEVEPEAIRKAVKEAGFTLRGIFWDAQEKKIE